MRVRQVAEKNRDARFEEAMEAWEVHVQLQGAPQTNFGIVVVFGADQQVERLRMMLKQFRRDVRSEIASGAGQKNGHTTSGSCFPAGESARVADGGSGRRVQS